MSQSAPVLDRRSVFVSLVLVTLMVLVIGGMAIYVLSDPGIEPAYRLVAAAIHIEKNYHGQVDWDRLVVAARRAITGRLDRYTDYVTSSAFSRMEEQESGAYGGIGVTVIADERGLLIVSVRENGPSDEAGLLTGDIIVTADSRDFAAMSLSEASAVLRGEEGTAVALNVYRPVDRDTLNVTVVRRRIPFVHVPYAGLTPDSVVYIRLLDFDSGAADDVRAAVDSLVADSTRNSRGLILDLRGNPGGLLVEACRTADLFLGEHQFVVGTEGRSRWSAGAYFATGEDLAAGLPMAVIVDRGSASSAEIVAGALQQAGRAALVGDTTFGKGLVQTYIRFLDGDGLRLTVSRYYLDGPVYLNDFDSTLNDVGHGLVPDFYCESARGRSFPRALENSLLLQRFAGEYQNEIIDRTGEDGMIELWSAEVAAFAACEGFTYQTPRTELIAGMVELAVSDSASNDVNTALAGLLAASRHEDERQFYIHRGYIYSRLKEIAFQRKYSTTRAYREVIVREHPAVVLAVDIVLGR